MDSFGGSNPSTGVRKVTLLYYLNPEWDDAIHGGALRLYLDSSTYDIYPHGDRMLIFLSERLEHEVLPAFNTRFSLTLWMYGGVTAPALGTRAGHAVLQQPTVHDDVALSASAPDELSPSIFVSIVCYRDSECQHTLNSLFARASRPDRVYAGVVWQLDDDDKPDCCSHSILSERASQVCFVHQV